MHRTVLLALSFLFGLGCSEPPAPAPQAPPQVVTPTAAPDEAGALSWLVKINAAQRDHFERFRRYALTTEDLVTTLMLPAEPDSKQLGYEIKLRPSAAADKYTLLAVPLSDTSAHRYFFSDSTGVLRAENGKEAGPQSPAVPGEKAK